MIISSKLSFFDVKPSQFVCMNLISTVSVLFLVLALRVGFLFVMFVVSIDSTSSPPPPLLFFLFIDPPLPAAGESVVPAA